MGPGTAPVPLGHPLLKRHGACHGIDGTGELNQHAVTGRLDDAAIVPGDRGIDDFTAVVFKASSVPTSSVPSAGCSQQHPAARAAANRRSTRLPLD